MTRKVRNGLRVLTAVAAVFLLYVVYQERTAFYRTGENASLVGDKITILTLGNIDSSLGSFAWSYGGRQITGRYALKPEEVAKLKAEFEKLAWNIHGSAGCHDPGFVIQGSYFLFPTDDISVCFNCNNIEIGGFISRYQKDFLPSSATGLREVLVNLTKH